MGTVENKDIQPLKEIFEKTRDDRDLGVPEIKAGDTVIVGAATQSDDNGRGRTIFDLSVIPEPVWELFKKERPRDYLDRLYIPLPTDKAKELISSTHVYEKFDPDYRDTYSSRGTQKARKKFFDQSTFLKLTGKTVPAFDSGFYTPDETVKLTRKIIGNEFFKLQYT